MKATATPPPAALPTLHPQIHRDARGEPTAVTLPYAEYAALEATARAHEAAQQKRRAQRVAQRLARQERAKQEFLAGLREAIQEVKAHKRGEIEMQSIEDFLAEIATEDGSAD